MASGGATRKARRPARKAAAKKPAAKSPPKKKTPARQPEPRPRKPPAEAAPPSSTPRSTQGDVLVTLARELAEAWGDRDRCVPRITETIAHTMGVARVSVWIYEESTATSIRCLDLYERDGDKHTSGQRLLAAQFPAYFDAIRGHRIVPADDAARHVATREFKDVYLAPHDITAMMDAGIRSGETLLGVLCCEHTHTQRNWTAEEQSFAGSVADLVSLIFEVSRRKQAELELEHQRRFLKQVLDITPSLIYAKDRQGRFAIANRAAATRFGTTVDELIGRTEIEVTGKEDAEIRRVEREVVETRHPHSAAEELVVDPRGLKRWYQAERRPILDESRKASHVLCMAIDITERRRAEQVRAHLEASLRQSQKLESIGLLAGGVAHDFNNLLTPILMNASVALTDRSPDDPLTVPLREIVEAAERARELTAQLLAFGRKQMLSLKPLDVNDAIVRVVKMLARSLPDDIRCETELSEDVSAVLADANQLQQVFVNLALNARDAMPDGGVLRFTTRTDIEARKSGPVPMAVITVEDSGLGMTEEVRAQIFEPFFTTKELGRGSGLGLAMVYGIITQHGGTIDVRSSEGRGSTFEIRLPIAVAVAGSPRYPSTTAEGTTILVVEDEPAVRRVIDRMLRGFGYRVLLASSADEALSVSRGSHLDLLLTDVIMAGTSGAELHARLVERGRPLRALFMSDGTEEQLEEPAGAVRDPGVHFIRKPFSPAELIAKVRLALETRD